MYIGQTNDPYYFPNGYQGFYFQLITRYNQELYTGPAAAPWNVSYLSKTRFTIDGVVDANKQPVIDSPIEWLYSTPGNNSGNGYDFPGPNNGWYTVYGNTQTYLTFKIKSTNVAPGQYFVKISSSASVMATYDGATTYTFAQATDTDYIRFSIQSNLGPFTTPDMTYSVVGITEGNNQEPIYAGAMNEKIGILNPSNAAWYYQITKFTAAMNITSTKVTLLTNLVTGTTPQTIAFRVNVDKSTPPAMVSFGLKLSYTVRSYYGGVVYDIVEAVTIQSFAVTFTPTISVPDNNGMTLPLATLVQNTPNATFSIPIRNDGNVDLKYLKIRLDLDRTSYFINNNFFYDENNYASQAYCDTIVDLGTLKVGESKEAVFPDIQLKNNLPPGKYLIKLEYTCYYTSDGALKPSGDYFAGQADYYLSDFANVVRSTSFPEDQRNVWNIFPAVYVKILDDDRGVELDAQNYNPSYGYTPGAKNVPLYVYMYNRERYAFTDVKFTFHTNGTSPIKNQNAPDNDPTPTLQQTFKYTNWNGNGGLINFNPYADIKDSAAPGQRFVTVDFEGYTPYMVKMTKTLQFPIVIFPANPSIQLVRTSVDVSSSNTVGTITAVVKNFGLGNARNVTAYFVPNTGLRCTDDIIVVGDLLSDGMANVTIHLIPNSPSSSLWGQQGGTLYFGYQTDTGSQVRIYSGPSTGITYQFMPKLPVFTISSVEAPDMNIKKTFNVKITVTNIGGSPADATNVMLINPNSQFGVKGSLVQSLGSIAPGESKNITYQLTTAGYLPLQTTFNFNLDFSYKRVDGDVRTFNEVEKPSFNLRTKDREVSALQQSKQMVEHSGYQFEIGYLMIGLFLMIGLYFISSALKTRMPPAAPPMQPQMAPPPSPPSGPVERSVPPPRP